MSTTNCFSAIRGRQGDPGQSQYVYYAFATDNAGAGFSLTPDASHKYVQWIISTVPIASLTIANFTGTWIKYIGDDGNNGINGAFEGIEMKFAAGFGAPAAGQITFDNAAMLSVTQIKIADTDANTTAIGLLVNTIGTSTAAIKAVLKIVSRDDKTKQALFAVTSTATIGIGYHLFSVSPLAASASAPWVATDPIVFSFAISGNNGAAGADGAPGTIILFNDLTQSTSSTLVGTDTLTWNIPANTLVNDGDVCEFESEVSYNIQTTPITIDDCSLFIDTNGTSLAFLANANPPPFGVIKVKVSVNRINATNIEVTQHLSSQLTVTKDFAYLASGFNPAAAFPINLLFNNNVTVGAAPVATINRAILKYIPKP